MITIEATLVACFVCLCFGLIVGNSVTKSYYQTKIKDIKDFNFVTNSFSELMKRIEEEYGNDN